MYVCMYALIIAAHCIPSVFQAHKQMKECVQECEFQIKQNKKRLEHQDQDPLMEEKVGISLDARTLLSQQQPLVGVCVTSFCKHVDGQGNNLRQLMSFGFSSCCRTLS